MLDHPSTKMGAESSSGSVRTSYQPEVPRASAFTVVNGRFHLSGEMRPYFARQGAANQLISIVVNHFSHFCMELRCMDRIRGWVEQGFSAFSRNLPGSRRFTLVKDAATNIRVEVPASASKCCKQSFPVKKVAERESTLVV